jgi:hypothetical protein
MMTRATDIWSHLPSEAPKVRETPRQRNPLAESMWPSLAPKPQPKSNPQRDALLRNLRDLNAKIDARLKKGK